MRLVVKNFDLSGNDKVAQDYRTNFVRDNRHAQGSGGKHQALAVNITNPECKKIGHLTIERGKQRTTERQITSGMDWPTCCGWDAAIRFQPLR